MDETHDFVFIRDGQKRGTQVTSLSILNIEDDITLEEIKRKFGHDMSTAVKEITEEIDTAALRNVVNEAEYKESKQ